MAGDWIKMTAGLRTHPKVRCMASSLKADKLRVIGGLFSVWCIFDEHTADGVLEGYTLDAMDEELHWRGFSAAMQSIGWLDESKAGLQAPDFDEHNSKSAKRRALDADRKRSDRQADETAHGSWTASGQTSASEADKKRTREELEKNKNIPSVCGDAKSRALKQAPKTFGLTPELGKWCHENTPSVDPIEEMAKFKDHTFKNALKDWDGTFRNWMRNAAGYARNGANGSHKPQQSTKERNAEAMRILGFKNPGDQEVIDA